MCGFTRRVETSHCGQGQYLMTIESYPCPKCGETRLIYEEMLVWRSGPRPPRNSARKQVGFSPRADYERERLYRCDHCGAEYFQDMEQKSPHLYPENAAGQYAYNRAWKTWELRGLGTRSGEP